MIRDTPCTTARNPQTFRPNGQGSDKGQVGGAGQRVPLVEPSDLPWSEEWRTMPQGSLAHDQP